MTLVKNQEVLVNWNSKHKKYYMNKGYKFTKLYDEIKVNAQDLPIYSKMKVDVRCDTCGRGKKMSFCSYYRQFEKLGFNNCKQHLQSYYENCFDKEGYQLLSEVRNAKAELKFICNKGHDGKTNWNKFKNGTRCKKCRIENRCSLTRFNYQFVKEIFDSRGYQLLTESYRNVEQKLEFICPNNHKHFITFSSFYYNLSDCGKCRGMKTGNRDRHSYEYIQEKFKDRGYFILSPNYLNSSQKLVYLCPEGHVGTIKYCHFKSGHGCFDCGVINRTGEKSPRWNPKREMADRVKRRQYNEYTKFREDVFFRDDFTCLCCCQRGGELVVHHLDGYHWCDEKRTDPENGVTLCKSCHIDFHSANGSKNNKREQYEFWIKHKKKCLLILVG
ncbi:HNH endonuclease [Salipaludibacillus aurantiacus]|uniref:HNH endonuclease n=1 Tax=Salipaludibacillus aurantiacus TaxID=1601833 RepID=UPI000B84DC31|nr:HNH endonuclease signature motif containing protein [Salipaludibacillus aurantiacus]